MLTFLQALALLEQVFFFLGYFSSANSFQEKLSREDELDCLTRLRDTGDEEARMTLISHNLRLVAHITKKYSTCSIPQEDLLSIGTIGLIKGINTYDMSKGSKFASYIAKCIDNEILMAIRNESKLAMNVFLEDVIGADDEGNNISLIDVVQHDSPDICDKVDLDMETMKLNGFIDSALTPRERMILKMRYGLDNHDKYTQIQIAESLHISRSYVSRIEKKAIEKLAREFQRID